MQQALHILRKDARHLYREIVLVWILAVVLVRVGGWAEGLLIANVAFLIGRLIHEEAIPGDRQFWITRPYRWQSLLGAKLIFIFLFVALPVALAQFAIVWMEGFPVAARLPGLLWSQVLLMLCVWLPIAALASMTAGGLNFLFTSLGLLALGFLGAQTLLSRAAEAWPSGVQWVRTMVAGAALAGAALWIVYLQYKDRRTATSRALAAAVAVAGLGIYWSLPWRSAFQLQAWLAHSQAEGKTIQMTLNRDAPIFLQSFLQREPTSLHVPLVLSGIAPGGDVRLDVATVTMTSAGGQRWKSQTFSMLGSSEQGGSARYEGVFPMNATFTRAVRAEPVKIDLSAQLTVFGHAREKTAPVPENAVVNLTDGLQCYRDRFSVLYCRSAFRWPGALVYAKLTNTIASPINNLISYAPFAADLSLNPIEEHWGSGPPLSRREVTLVVKEPIAYIRRDLEIRDVRLDGFQGTGLLRGR